MAVRYRGDAETASFIVSAAGPSREWPARTRGKSRFHLRPFPPVGIHRLDQAALPTVGPTPDLGGTRERGRVRLHSFEPDQEKRGQMDIVGRAGPLEMRLLDLPHHVSSRPPTPVTYGPAR